MRPGRRRECRSGQQVVEADRLTSKRSASSGIPWFRAASWSPSRLIASGMAGQRSTTRRERAGLVRPRRVGTDGGAELERGLLHPNPWNCRRNTISTMTQRQRDPEHQADSGGDHQVAEISRMPHETARPGRDHLLLRRDKAPRRAGMLRPRVMIAQARTPSRARHSRAKESHTHEFPATQAGERAGQPGRRPERDEHQADGMRFVPRSSLLSARVAVVVDTTSVSAATVRALRAILSLDIRHTSLAVDDDPLDDRRSHDRGHEHCAGAGAFEHERLAHERMMPSRRSRSRGHSLRVRRRVAPSRPRSPIEAHRSLGSKRERHRVGRAEGDRVRERDVHVVPDLRAPAGRRKRDSRPVETGSRTTCVPLLFAARRGRRLRAPVDEAEHDDVGRVDREPREQELPAREARRALGHEPCDEHQEPYEVACHQKPRSMSAAWRDRTIPLPWRASTRSIASSTAGRPTTSQSHHGNPTISQSFIQLTTVSST